MGLAEKKSIRHLEENVIPTVKEELAKSTGKAIEVEVNWDEFQTVDQIQELEHQCFGRVVKGISMVAEDDLGKEAIQESISVLSINNLEDASAKNVSIADGKLVVACKWEDFSNGIFTDYDYSKKIEDLL